MPCQLGFYKLREGPGRSSTCSIMGNLGLPRRVCFLFNGFFQHIPSLTHPGPKLAEPLTSSLAAFVTVANAAAAASII